MKKLMPIFICFSLIFSCQKIKETARESIMSMLEDNPELMSELEEKIKESQKDNSSDEIKGPTKYEVVHKKAFFYSVEEMKKSQAYLVEGDVALCGDSDIIEYNEFCFCWFQHKTGTVTTGYLYNSDLMFQEESYSSKWQSLKNLSYTKNKTYFFRPKTLSRSKAYLLKGDIAICDKDVIQFQGKDFCYCEFKKSGGSNIGKTTVGYLEKEKLQSW